MTEMKAAPMRSSEGQRVRDAKRHANKRLTRTEREVPTHVEGKLRRLRQPRVGGYRTLQMRFTQVDLAKIAQAQEAVAKVMGKKPSRGVIISAAVEALLEVMK